MKLRKKIKENLNLQKISTSIKEQQEQEQKEVGVKPFEEKSFEVGDAIFFMRLNEVREGVIVKKVRTQTATVDVTWHTVKHSEGTTELRSESLYKGKEELIKAL